MTVRTDFNRVDFINVGVGESWIQAGAVTLNLSRKALRGRHQAKSDRGISDFGKMHRERKSDGRCRAEKGVGF
jgi:hypothetical protein